jgi:hypothetical protein
MPQIIECDLNAGMERLLSFGENGNSPDIAKNDRFSVYIDIVNPNTGNEQRYIRVVEKATGNERKVLLNQRGGAKPSNGNNGMYEPRRRRNPRLRYDVDIETHRVFFSEINLSADPSIEVYLRIDTYNDLEDHRRYLSFVRTGLTPLTEEFGDIDLEDGKKPLGGG